MRKFTLILVAAMTALSLSAAAGTHTTRIRGQVENPALKARLQKMPAVINGHKLDSRLLEHPEKAQSMLRQVRRAEEAAPKPVTNVPVEETPAGTSTSWSRDSYAYLSYLGMVFAIEDYGFACNLVDAANGVVWANNPFSTIELDSWVKGSRDAAGNVTFDGG